MTRLTTICSCLLTLALLSGCAHLRNRGADLRDVVTLSVERGNIGASVRAGPIPAGLSFSRGEGFALCTDGSGIYWYTDYNVLFLFAHRSFHPEDTRGDKAYEQEMLIIPIPGLDECLTSSEYEGPWQTHTQVEASLGLYFGLRAGLNAGELLDFLLGWVDLDPCQDDEVFE